MSAIGSLFRRELDLAWGYPVALILMAGVSGALFVAFKKLKWL